MDSTALVEPATVIVAVDFGTTYSGFSYAHRHLTEVDPDNFIDNVEGFEQWPAQGKAGARHYCKTQTSLLYVRENSSSDYQLRGWGWAACYEHDNLLRKSHGLELAGKSFHFVTNFKLGLAGSKGTSCTLPEGLTFQRVISDYLHELSILIVDELKKKYGKHIGKKDIQWCLTVPAMWDNAAKQQMKWCAEIAGLVAGPLNVHDGDTSVHPIIIVLEPEAASVYSLHHLRKTRKMELPAKSKILVVDAGGGTVDTVFHETMNSGTGIDQVREICSGSSGALCGATFVDEAFYKFLSRKITCFDKFIKEYPTAMRMIRREWEDMKVCFDGAPGPYVYSLAAQMSKYWEAHDQKLGLHQPDYDEVNITLEEMKFVFDSVVDKVLKLIEEQLAQVTGEGVDALLVVGGFSGSPYLMDQIQSKFGRRVKHIINPTYPGRAVVTGAVVYGSLGRTFIVSRISRKTYGIATTRDFRLSDPISHRVFGNVPERQKCKNTFHVYTRKGDEVPVDYCEKREYGPLFREDNSISLDVYSTSDTDPSYVTDLGAVKECSYRFPIPSKKVMKSMPKIEVSMYFGRTSIEVSAVALNFKSDKVILPSVIFETEGAE